jgi:hypothetical protein
LRRRRQLTGDPLLAAEIARHVTGSRHMTPEEQVEVYREQFWLRHTASLVEDFPGLGGILGQRDWEHLVEEYLEAHPPASFTLRNVGARLPEHVARAKWLPHRALCVDMARLEWATLELFDAAAAPPLAPDALERIAPDAWENAVIVLAPTVRLLEVRFPVIELRWQLRAGGGPVPLPDPRPQRLVLFRDADLAIAHREVPASAFELLSALDEGARLGDALDRAAERVPAEAAALAEHIGPWFAEWGRLGWIADVRA